MRKSFSERKRGGVNNPFIMGVFTCHSISWHKSHIVYSLRSLVFYTKDCYFITQILVQLKRIYYFCNILL